MCRLGLSHSPGCGLIWVVGVWTAVLWGVGETTWMDTLFPGWGLSGRSVIAEPTGDKQEMFGYVFQAKKDPYNLLGI